MPGPSDQLWTVFMPLPGRPVKETVRDDGDDALTGEFGGIEPHVAGAEARGIFGTEAHAEGDVDGTGGIEGVLAFPLEPQYETEERHDTH